MADPVALGPGLWMDGPTYNGEIARQMGVAATWFTAGTVDSLSVRGGVINNSTGSLQVLPVSGMGIKVAAGFAIVPNTANSAMAGYQIGSMTSSALTVDSADATNPRIDLVVIGINDTGDDTGAGFIEIVNGTPASSPAVPATPANSLALGSIKVAANAVSVSSTNITDLRLYTTAAGGVVPWPSLTGIPAGHPGLIAYDVTNSRFFHNDSAGADQLATLPWQPVYATVNSATQIPTGVGNYSTITSVNFTTDGHTDIKVTTHVPGFYATGCQSGWYNQHNLAVFVDSTEISGTWQGVNCTMISSSGTSITQGGCTDVYCTSSATGDTPSAGSHTLYWKTTCVRYGVNAASGNTSTPYLRASTTENAYLRVEPVAK